jgi:hypothetical protein
MLQFVQKIYRKVCKISKNQEKRFDIVMFYIERFGVVVCLSPPPKSGDAKGVIVMSDRII